MSLLQVIGLYLFLAIGIGYGLARHGIADPEEFNQARRIMRISYLWPMYLVIVLLAFPVITAAFIGQRAGRPPE